MAAKFCTQCGSEVGEGKQFCGRCGTAIAKKPQSPELQNEVAGSPAILSATRTAPQEMTVSSTDAVAVDRGPVTQAVPVPVQVNYLPENTHPFPEPSQNLPATHLQNFGLPPLEQESSAEREVFGIASDSPARSYRVLIGAGVVVVALAIGAGCLYAWHRKSAEPGVVSTAAETRPSSNLPPPLSPEPAKKPDAGISASVQNPAPAPVTGTEPHITVHQNAGNKIVRSPDVSMVPFNSVDPAPDRQSAPAPIVRDIPGSSTTGVLRYSGPPIHYGEVITFSGLPGAMLRFSFDHASWAPRITHQPDGTQTLTLRSLDQQDQTQCEVRWEVAK